MPTLRAKGFALTALVLMGLAVSATPVRAADRGTVALFNLRPTNMEAMAPSSEILFTLVSALEQEKRVEVMPRRQMEEILYQKGMVQGDNAAVAAQAGKVLGVDFVLFGQVTEAGGRIRTRLQLLNVPTARVVRTWTPAFADRDAILVQAPAIARDLAGAIAGGAGSSASAETSPGTPAAGPALAVASLGGASQGDRITLKWTCEPASPVKGFHVYRSENAGGPFQFMGGTREGRFEDKGVKPGTTYYYRIGILSDQGSEVKDSRTAMVKHSAERRPHPPLLMVGTGHVRRTAFQFVPSLQNQQEGFAITDYRIYRRGGQDGPWRLVQTLNAGKKSQYELAYSVEDAEGLDDGLNYEYSVASVDAQKGESALSDAIALTTVARPELAVARDGLLRRVDFRWAPLKAVDGYRLYRRNGDDSWQRVGERRSTQSPQWTDERDLDDGRQYAYYLTAYDQNAETGPSRTVSARTKDLPPAPADVAARSGQVKSVPLSWSPSSDPDVGGYTIYRGTAAAQLEAIDKVSGHETSAYGDDGSGFTPLEDGRTYFYMVESFNRFGADGGLSPVVSATTKPRPRMVGQLSAAAAGEAVVVTWAPNAESDIRANILYRSQDQGSWSKLQSLSPDQTRFEDRDLKPGTSYRYRVIAEDVDGLESDPALSAPVASPLAPPEG